MPSSSEKIYSVSPVWFQNLLVSLYGMGLKRKRYSGGFKKTLDRLRSFHHTDKSVLDELRLLKLKEMLNFCNEHIPYYKRLFKEQKIEVSALNGMKNFTDIPILEKGILREEIHSFSPEDYRKRRYALQHTSGSTGTPLSVFVDQYTYHLSMALLVDHEGRHGIKMGDRRATFAGRMIQEANNNKPPFWRYNMAEHQMLFSAYHLSEGNLSFYVDKLNRFRPHEMIGYSSAIYTLAKYCEQENRRFKFIPKAIITNSETLHEWQREVIERVFRCRIYDYYGTAECVTFAGQCSMFNYHINPFLGILEVVDPEGVGIQNEMGEIVCTTLTNYAMPLIRYKIGDMGILSDEHCDCGCPYPILKSVEGRIDDIVVTADGKKIGRLDHIFKGIGGLKECQIVQKSIGNFSLRIVKNKKFKDQHLDDIKENLKKRVGEDIDILVEYVEKIDRTSRGKFKGVINEMKNTK